MSFELYYTSAERGLKPHSRGFCTVARTEGLAPPVIERLESLSNYQPLYPAGSELADRNPIAFAHWRIPMGGRTRSVLSRVAFVRSDYNGRPGKFAYHLVLDPSEQWPAGPVAMMTEPALMQTAWAGEPRLLPPRRLQQESFEQGVANDATAQAAQLAEAFRVDPEKPVFVIYRIGTDMLSILDQAIALLIPALRWQVTFNTYFTELPAGLNCAWRCVVADTPAASAARAAKGLVLEV
jgi:hypothetical protein